MRFLVRCYGVRGTDGNSGVGEVEDGYKGGVLLVLLYYCSKRLTGFFYSLTRVG